jgi:hypothetical protein
MYGLKRIGKIHGVLAFSSIQSNNNKYAELHAMMLTATKAHDQFMPILGEISRSIAMFGHAALEVVFTDRVHTDNHKPEKMFPSL